jgi:hypothetical protein
MKLSTGILLAATLWLAASAAHAQSVQGNTYEGDMAKIVFKSGGIAMVSLGPMNAQCTYAQSGKTVSVTCEGDKEDYTIANDGSLNNPQVGRLGKTN